MDTKNKLGWSSLIAASRSAGALWAKAAFGASMALAATAALCGCGASGERKSFDIPVADTDVEFIRLMLSGSLSTRASPKSEARFVLSETRDLSSRSTYRLASVIIDRTSGCEYTIDYYVQESGSKLVGPVPGAPGAGKEILDAPSPEFGLSANREECVAAAMRPDLAKARALMMAVPATAQNKAFAAAAQDLAVAIAANGDASAPGRFLLTSQRSAPSSEASARFLSTATEAKNGESARYELIERATGCVWTVAKSGSGLAPVSIEPASCARSAAP